MADVNICQSQDEDGYKTIIPTASCGPPEGYDAEISRAQREEQACLLAAERFERLWQEVDQVAGDDAALGQLIGGQVTG